VNRPKIDLNQTRRIQKKFENKLKLEEVIRKQEDYNKKAWNEQKKIIKETFEFGTDDEEKIKDITQEDKDNEYEQGG
jgi:hypothetical protein